MSVVTMRFAANILSNEQVPAAKAGLFIPRSNYLIDPAVVSQNLGEYAKYKEAIDAAVALEQRISNQTVDAGALALDELFGGLGLNTNLAGARKRATRIMPLADDVVYKRQTRMPKATEGGGPGTDVEFIRLANTPMLDWDLPGPSHLDANVTVRNLGDVEDLVRSYVDQHPESALRVYSSPGGYRAWELSETMTPQEFQPRFEELKADPDYARISLNSTPWEPTSFASRISHKPGRVDWVAQPLFEIRGPQSSDDPRSRQLIQQLHDRPIEQHYLTSGGVSPDAMARLETNLPSASQALQSELKRRFKIR